MKPSQPHMQPRGKMWANEKQTKTTPKISLWYEPADVLNIRILPQTSCQPKKTGILKHHKTLETLRPGNPRMTCFPQIPRTNT